MKYNNNKKKELEIIIIIYKTRTRRTNIYLFIVYQSSIFHFFLFQKNENIKNYTKPHSKKKV